MKREDFKEILPVHVDNCKKIIKQKGECTGVDCKECPFTFFNSTNEKDCVQNDYAGRGQLEKTAEEFLEKFEDEALGIIPPATPISYRDERLEEAIDSTTEFLRECKEQEVDNVNQPNHYKLDGLDVEVLDIIKAVLTKEQFEGALHFNVIKYILRTNKKNGVEDLKKAHKYLGWLIDSKNGLKLNK